MAARKSREFRFPNRLAELDGLAEGLRRFCLERGMSDEEVGDVRLAVEEAVSNTIRHGYADQERHEIRVRATLDRGKLRLEIEDDARPFNPLDARPPDVGLPVEEKSVGGLGIFLLRSLMDRLEYRRKRDRNILSLVRVLGRK